MRLARGGGRPARRNARRGTNPGRQLYPDLDLDPDWWLIADRNFYGFADWNTARTNGTQLLWRVSASLTLPVLAPLPDGSYTSVLIHPKIRGTARTRLVEAARAGAELDPERAVVVRVVEYTVPDRAGNGSGELIALLTTITDPTHAPAAALAQAYHQRWEHESGNDQLKTHLRGPAKILRSKKPDTVRQEIHGYLLIHYALSALICRAATETDIDPDRIKFTRTVRIIRRRVTDPAAFSPEHQARTLTKVVADITSRRNLNPRRRHRSYLRVIKRARHNHYREDPRLVLPGFDGVLGQPVPYGGRREVLTHPVGHSLAGQLGARPAGKRCRALRGRGAGQGLDLGDLHRGELGRAPAAFGITQRGRPGIGRPAAPPLAHRVPTRPQRGGDRRRWQARRRPAARSGRVTPGAVRPARSSLVNSRRWGSVNTMTSRLDIGM